MAAKVFTLSELLSDAVTLVIPDIQRDYAWAGTRSAAFVSGIAELFARHRDGDGASAVTAGLIYGYSDSDSASRICIIDGHQRMVTLFLLLGMLYRRVRQPWLRSMLISDRELADDCEPRIIYQSKRDAYYFISDLTTRFFLDRDGRLSKLEESPWYYKVYDSDVTVQSIIGSLRSIDGVLERMAESADWDFEAFARFVAYELAIVYCGFSTRREAEQMFITINTTGRPLTLPQHLRSLTLAIEADAEAAAKRWNEMEDWAWMHRPAGCDTSDSALSDFLLLMAEAKRLANGDTDPQIPSILAMDFTKLYHAFKAYARVMDCAEMKEAAEQWPAMIVLPAMAYVMRFQDSASDREVARFCRFLANICRYQRPAANGSDTLAAIKLAQAMPSPDILSLLSTKRVSDRLLNAEERAKLQFIADNARRRGEAESVISRAEDHPLLNGRAAKLIAWSEKSADPIGAIRHYTERIYEIWGEDIDKREELDPVRRALLALRHPDYPMPRRGNNMFSLCWHAYDWQRLMLNSPGIVRLLIDRLENSSLEEIASRCSWKKHPYCIFVKDRDLLAYSRKRLVSRPCPPFMGVYDMRLCRQRWLVEQREFMAGAEQWAPVRAYGSRCLYTDNLYLDIAIDLYYTPEEKQPYRIELFNRLDSDTRKRVHADLRQIAGALRMPYDKGKKRYAAVCNSAQSVLAAISRIQSLVSELY